MDFKNKNGLIFGVANHRSIAFNIAKLLSENGAKIGYSYQNERVKISVLINTRELRADGINVSVFKQKLKSNTWTNIKVDPIVVTKLERKIVRRAGSIANSRD